MPGGKTVLCPGNWMGRVSFHNPGKIYIFGLSTFNRSAGSKRVARFRVSFSSFFVRSLDPILNGKRKTLYSSSRIN